MQSRDRRLEGTRLRRWLRRRLRRLRRRAWERGEQRHFRRLSAEVGASLHRSHLHGHHRSSPRDAEHRVRAPRAESPRARSSRNQGRRGPSQWQWWWRLPAAVVVLAFIAALLGGIAGLLALGPLHSAINELSSAETRIRGATPSSAVADLRSARADFSRARASLDAWWADPAEWVPGARQQLEAARSAAAVGGEITSTGIALAPNVKLSGASFGPPLLHRLASLQSDLESAGVVLSRAHRQLASARSGWVLSPIESKLDGALSTITTAQHDDRVAVQALAAARRLLGADGPQRLFLAFDTPAELRGGGGVLGNYGLLVGHDGTLSLRRFGRDSDLDAAGLGGARKLVAPASYRALYSYLNPQVYWQNVLASPDFPLDAQAIDGLYPQSGGTPVDGVIAVDPEGLADLLSIVGSVKVPSWPVPITSANAASTLLHKEYDALSGSARVDFLGQVADAVWSRLITTRLPGLSQLAKAMAPAVAGKHLVLWSSTPTTERTLQALGAAGEMTRPKGSDFLAVTNTNATGDKIDYYLRRSVGYDLHLSASGNAAATVTIELRNLAPSSGQPAYVIGSTADPTAPTGTNITDVSIYSPLQFDDATVDGSTALLVPGSEAGLNVYSATVSIPPGGEVTLVVHLSGILPVSTTHPYRLELFRQATVAPDAVSVVIHAPSGWHIASTSSGVDASASVARASYQLESDEQLSVRFAR